MRELKVGINSRISMRGSVSLSGYVLDLGDQGDILPELQDRAVVDICDCVQEKRAEDEDKGSVRIFVNVVLARGFNILIILMLNMCRLYILQIHVPIGFKSPHP